MKLLTDIFMWLAAIAIVFFESLVALIVVGSVLNLLAHLGSG
jgi:hypothetical protein